VIKVLTHVLRNINEFNIPSGDTYGYEILYFGVNLILMYDYRLSFDIELKSSGGSNKIEVLIISRKDVSAWKNNVSTQELKFYYSKNGQKINDIFKPSISDAYAFILSNRSSYMNDEPQLVGVTLIHSWQQEIKESQLRTRM
jgi:hypothetical protein